MIVKRNKMGYTTCKKRLFVVFMKGEEVTYEEFAGQLSAQMREKLGGDIQISRQRIRKNNSVMRDGMTIKTRGSSLSPVIYVDSLYESLKEGTSFDDILDSILAVCRDTQDSREEGLEDFASWEKACRRVVPRLISTARNAALLKEVPHRNFLNLTEIYYYLPESRAWEESSVLVRNEHMALWHVDEQELHEKAELNKYHLMPAVFTSIGEMLRDLTGQDEPWVSDDSLYVLTSRDKCWGAAWMSDTKLLARIRRRLGCDFYILPSSVHEVMILPQLGKTDAASLMRIVSEINEQQVPDEEILEDTVYVYREGKAVSIAVTES